MTNAHKETLCYQIVALSLVWDYINGFTGNIQAENNTQENEKSFSYSDMENMKGKKLKENDVMFSLH